MSQLKFDVKMTDAEGEETLVALPAKHEVCGRCEGHGTHLTPSIGQHAYTREEFSQFSDDERDAYFTRGGMYDVECEICHGVRVVVVINRKACTTPEQKGALAAHDKSQREDAFYESLVQSEIRMGC